MSRIKIIISVTVFILIAGIIILVFYRNEEGSSGLSIRYPFNDALFPPEFPAPSFEWSSQIIDSAPWEVSLVARNKRYSITTTTTTTKWTPEESKWDSLKLLSDFGKVNFTVRKTGSAKLSKKISFSISHDTVGAPILYRQMPIPVVIAEKNLDSMNYMLINIGSKNRPHVAMRGFPVCGNCHSFNADGSSIGLDLDAGLRDKGGYFISPIRDTILFNAQNYMSWSKRETKDFRALFQDVTRWPVYRNDS